jgi:hypothetical protein
VTGSVARWRRVTAAEVVVDRANADAGAASIKTAIIK